MHFPRNHRFYKPLLYLMSAELPFIVVLLILTGIASHDLYRTKLWQDGADNGFNSSPDESVYASANYRSYTTPLVWTSLVSNYTLVLAVLSIFLLITKIPMLVLRVFYPPISVVINGASVGLYVASARFQADSDMSDPQHPQPGPPWFISKSCKLAAHKSNIGYCQQAKTLFIITVIISAIFFAEFAVSVISCFETKEEREQRRERREEKRALKEYEESILRSPSMIPMTPAPPMTAGGMMTPYTPRTLAFNRLGGTSGDLPLRDHFSSPHPRRFHGEDAPPLASGAIGMAHPPSQSQPQPQPVPPEMYFPPPPKKAAK